MATTRTDGVLGISGSWSVSRAFLGLQAALTRKPLSSSRSPLQIEFDQDVASDVIIKQLWHPFKSGATDTMAVLTCGPSAVVYSLVDSSPNGATGTFHAK